MRKIVHLTNVHYWRDTRIFLKMCTSLAVHGFEVALVALDREAVQNEQFADQDVSVYLVAGNRVDNRLKRATTGARAVISQGLKLGKNLTFHLHDPELIPWIPYLRLRGHKVIFDAHEDFVAQNDSRDWARGWRQFPIKAIAGTLRLLVNTFASHVLTATEKIATNHPKNKTTVINNYPIIGELRRESADNQPLSHRPKRGIYVGGMNEIRGLKQIVEALPLTQEVEGVDLLGEFQDPALLEELKAHPGWAKVKHHGMQSRENVAKLMAQARFGIVTFHPLRNHVDAQPNKLFEYLSAGLVILHSDFPLWNKITRVPHLGRSCSPLDVPALAKNMDALVTDPQLDTKSEDAVAIINSTYNWPTEARKLIKTIEEI